MKKIFCVFLCVLMALAVVSCGAKEETLKFGLGIYTDVSSVTSADGDTNGQANAVMTFAAVTVDAEGKIVACDIDVADYSVAYTSEGKAIANDSFKTKYELLEDYGMKAYAGAAMEWYEQIDALETVISGKTLDQAKALIAADNYVSEEVITAGCTITIDAFILAVEKAYNNAVESDVTADDSVKVVSYTSQSCADATEEKNGTNQLDTTFFAAAVDADGKIAFASTDSIQLTFSFDYAGASTYDISKAVSTKKELGADYGMSAYGTDLNGDGVVKEWNEQAAAFDAACVGKTVSELSALADETGYGIADLQTAGCTMNISDFIKTAAKLG